MEEIQVEDGGEGLKLFDLLYTIERPELVVIVRTYSRRHDEIGDERADVERSKYCRAVVNQILKEEKKFNIREMVILGSDYLDPAEVFKKKLGTELREVNDLIESIQRPRIHLSIDGQSESVTMSANRCLKKFGIKSPDQELTPELLVICDELDAPSIRWECESFPGDDSPRIVGLRTPKVGGLARLWLLVSEYFRIAEMKIDI